ncbi:YopX family protein [Streptococcus sp. 27098_8_113]|uniref:YopX family protein n=1 Tax=Streptococcus sp. 27098_8_113 TaxID=3003669 RepID=UPI00352E6668
MIPKFRAWAGGSLCRMYQPDEVMVGNGDIWIVDEDSVAGDWIVNNDLELMQSTGFKDKNGKEIFEGDVVQFEDCYTESDFLYINKGIVEWSQGSFTVTNRDSVEMEDLLDGEILDVTIIGNIYENSALMWLDDD